LYEYCKLSVAAVSEGERREEEGGGREGGELVGHVAIDS